MSAGGQPPGVRTSRQREGDAAEDLVARRLEEAGWSVLARQLHVGRAELDIVAVDPGPASTTAPSFRSVRTLKARQRSAGGRLINSTLGTAAARRHTAGRSALRVWSSMHPPPAIHVRAWAPL